MSSPNIVFTGVSPQHREQVWNRPAQETARRLGWDVRMLPVATEPPTPDQWRELFAGAEAIITTWGAPRLDAETLADNDTLRFVGHAAGSVAGIVSPELFERGVRVSTANKEMADAVARWGLMMTLVGLRGLLEHAQLGTFAPLRWDNRNNGRDARNSTIGIWGHGDISRSLIELLKPLHPGRLLVCSRSLGEDEAREHGIERVDLDELFAQSDVIHLFQSLTPATQGAVKQAHLESMKPRAVLINAGRADLVDKDALLHALRTRPITAILDTHYEEPLAADSPFRTLPNVILTPHCAGKENHFLFASIMMEEFDRLLRGEPLRFEVTRDRALGMTNESLRAGK